MKQSERTPGRVLLCTSSLFMLILALPLTWWTFNMGLTASPYDMPGDSLATLGCCVGAAAYVWSLPVAIIGLCALKKPHRWNWCRVLGWVCVALLVACVVMQRAYFVLTMPPLVLLTALYLIAAYVPKRQQK